MLHGEKKGGIKLYPSNCTLLLSACESVCGARSLVCGYPVKERYGCSGASPEVNKKMSRVLQYMMY